MNDADQPLVPRDSPITVGERAPNFTLPAAAADQVQFEATLADYLARGRVLLVFYQDDGMPICTRELQAFAQEHETLRAAGVEVLGINTNGIGSHAKFQERDEFPFPLLSDFYGEVVKAYGMWDQDERKSRRGVVVVAHDGLVTFVLPHFNPGAVNSFAQVFDALGLA